MKPQRTAKSKRHPLGGAASDATDSESDVCPESGESRGSGSNVSGTSGESSESGSDASDIGSSAVAPPEKQRRQRRLTAADVLARNRESRINACHVVQPRLNHTVVYRRKSGQQELGRISIFGPKTHDGDFDFTNMTASVVCCNPKLPGCRWMISTYSIAGRPMEADAIYWL